MRLGLIPRRVEGETKFFAEALDVPDLWISKSEFFRLRLNHVNEPPLNKLWIATHIQLRLIAVVAVFEIFLLVVARPCQFFRRIGCLGLFFLFRGAFSHQIHCCVHRTRVKVVSWVVLGSPNFLGFS